MLICPGIQCHIPPMRKQKAKATAGMEPLEEGYDPTPHNQKHHKVDSVNDSGTVHMFKFITVLHLALQVTENLQASTSARPNTQRQSKVQAPSKGKHCLNHYYVASQLC